MSSSKKETHSSIQITLENGLIWGTFLNQFANHFLKRQRDDEEYNYLPNGGDQSTMEIILVKKHQPFPKNLDTFFKKEKANWCKIYQINWSHQSKKFWLSGTPTARISQPFTHCQNFPFFFLFIPCVVAGTPILHLC